MKLARRRRKKKINPLLRAVIATLALVMFWRGIWGILDEHVPASELLNWGSVALALLILYLDDFHLKELA